MEKIVIFGSTGMTGLCAVDAALKKGLSVKAFVRDPAKLPEHLRNAVEVVKGDILDYNTVLDGIKDVMGVVVVLGTRNDLSPTTDLSEGLKNIIKAMKELNVEVISVCLSAFLFYEPEKVPPQFHDLNDEHKRMLQVLQASDRKYIACFPPHIADQPPVDYIVKKGASPGGRVISKYDLGRFLVESLNQPEHYGQIVGICNKPS
ncbi:flavin reductase (NADPH) [Diorhabda carinulata]|uniref:flavin reductase (NADPH) n=1 Tax=Diorhabda carinulata TaxID=1163345 RepID=UPI0025A122E7|nr:flavin reductase (NADPH) [Diorhabda carinulata]